MKKKIVDGLNKKENGNEKWKMTLSKYNDLHTYTEHQIREKETSWEEKNKIKVGENMRKKIVYRWNAKGNWKREVKNEIK